MFDSALAPALGCGLAVWLWQADQMSPRAGLALAGICGGILVIAGGQLLPAAAWLLLALAGAVGWRVLVRRRARREARAATQDLMALIELLADELRAGRPLHNALVDVTTEVPRFAVLASAARLGADLPEALRKFRGEVPVPELELLAAAWQVASDSGRGLGQALAALAEQLRAAHATRGVVASELASAHATAKLLAALPLFALLLGRGLGVDPVAWLIETPLGWVCLGVGLAALTAGFCWLGMIARGVERLL